MTIFIFILKNQYIWDCDIQLDIHSTILNTGSGCQEHILIYEAIKEEKEQLLQKNNLEKDEIELESRTKKE